MTNKKIVVIGAGAVGSAVAMELSKFKLDVTLVDKNPDVGGDASKSNSAIIHTGFDAAPDTLESELVVAANPMYDTLCRDLDIPFKRTGALLVATTEEEHSNLGAILKKANKNRVYDIDYLTGVQAKNLEPQISPDTLGALLIHRESIIDPFILVVAMCENAATNGVKIKVDTKVYDLIKENGSIKGVMTNNGDIAADVVINCAGLHCDDISRMAGVLNFTEHPRKGQFFIIDKQVKYKPERIILPVPTQKTKGKLVAPTMHGNLLIGPTAEDGTDRIDKKTTSEGLDEVMRGAQKLVPAVSARDAITQYSGLRPVRTPQGYYIETFDKAKGYIEISGVRSTGVTSSVAIAKYLLNVLDSMDIELNNNESYKRYRQGIVKFTELSAKEKAGLIARNPKYGKVICRCETVTEAEILESIHRVPGARTVDGVKRRVRAGLGRCQGGFCGPQVLNILSRELNTSIPEVVKSTKDSPIVDGKSRK